MPFDVEDFYYHDYEIPKPPQGYLLLTKNERGGKGDIVWWDNRWVSVQDMSNVNINVGFDSVLVGANNFRFIARKV